LKEEEGEKGEKEKKKKKKKRRRRRKWRKKYYFFFCTFLVCRAFSFAGMNLYLQHMNIKVNVVYKQETVHLKTCKLLVYNFRL
jgi:hypothetical protein